MSYSGKITLALLLLTGCGPVQDAPPNPAPTDVASTSPATINPDLIELVDGRMERSKTFRMDGDLRPFWIVSARIKNDSSLELKSVTFRIDVTSRASTKVVDQAMLQIDTDIPSGSIGSFRREIQILPPSSGWDWSYAVIKAVPK
jgi:hypothetical protein